MRRIKTWGILVGLSLLCVSCATTPKKQSSTPNRVYDSSPDQVRHAAVAAFQNLGLDVFKNVESSNYVEGGRKPGFGRGAETVGVFIEEQGEGKTRVSVDNRKALWGGMFAVDWTDKIFQQIDAALGK